MRQSLRFEGRGGGKNFPFFASTVGMAFQCRMRKMEKISGGRVGKRKKVWVESRKKVFFSTSHPELFSVFSDSALGKFSVFRFRQILRFQHRFFSRFRQILRSTVFFFDSGVGKKLLKNTPHPTLESHSNLECGKWKKIPPPPPYPENGKFFWMSSR